MIRTSGSSPPSRSRTLCWTSLLCCWDVATCAEFGTLTFDPAQCGNFPNSPPGWDSFIPNNNFIHVLRGGRPTSAYSDILDGLVHSACPNEDPDVTDRCVDADSPSAASLAYLRGLDPNGGEIQEQLKECVVAADHICPTGQCERDSNCHWKEVFPGLRRSRRGDAEEDYADTDLGTNPYLSSLQFHIATWSVFAVATALGWIAFACLRFFCTSRANRLCSPVPKEEYAIRDVWIPKAAYVIFSMGAIGAAFSFSVGLSEVPIIADSALAHTEKAMVDADVKIQNLEVSIQLMSLDVQQKAVELASKLNASDVVEKFRVDIDDQLETFEEITADTLAVLNQLLVQRISEARTNVDAGLEKVQQQQDKSVVLIQSDVEEAMVNSSSDAANILEEASQNLYNITQALSFARSTLEKQEYTSRISGPVVAWTTITCLLGLALILIDGYTQYPTHRILNTVWISGAVLGTLACTMSAAALVLSILNYDACYVMDAGVESGFEPILGQTSAIATKSCFQQQHIMQAYKWNSLTYIPQSQQENIISIEEIDAEIDEVFVQLKNVQEKVDNATVTAFNAFNKRIAVYNNRANSAAFNFAAECPLLEQFDTVQASLKPWNNNDSASTWSPNTRQDNETNVQYMERTYAVSGVCRNFGGGCSYTENGVDKAVGLMETCNSGDGCRLPICQNRLERVLSLYATYVDQINVANLISANLGVTCPPGLSCPDSSFVAAGHPNTTVDTVRTFRNDLVDLVTSILDEDGLGGAIQKASVPVLCELECFFLAEEMQEVGKDLCVDLLDHAVGLYVAMVLLWLCLQGVGAAAAVLCVRLRPHQQADYGSGASPMEPSDLPPPRRLVTRLSMIWLMGNGERSSGQAANTESESGDLTALSLQPSAPPARRSFLQMVQWGVQSKRARPQVRTVEKKVSNTESMREEEQFGRKINILSGNLDPTGGAPSSYSSTVECSSPSICSSVLNTLQERR